MNFNRKLDHSEAESLLKTIFLDTWFYGFNFDMHFTLEFGRNKQAECQGVKLPWKFQIRILTDWWLDSENEWKDRVEKLTIYDLVEPDEPVKAYELACIRWREGSEVDSVCLKQDRMIITFKSGKSISILTDAIMDYSWVLSSNIRKMPEDDFNLICENQEFYFNVNS